MGNAAVLPLRPLTDQPEPVKLEDEDVAGTDPKLSRRLANFLDDYEDDRQAGRTAKELHEKLTTHIETDKLAFEEIREKLDDLRLENAERRGREAATGQQRLPYQSSPDSSRVTPTPPGLGPIPTPGPIVAVNVNGNGGGPGGMVVKASEEIEKKEKDGWGKWTRRLLEKPLGTVLLAIAALLAGWLLHYLDKR